MPLATDPSAQTNFHLAGDKHKPEAERPTFVLRFRSMRAENEYIRLVGDLDASKDPAERFKLAVQALSIFVTGWRNVLCEDGKPLDKLENLDLALDGAEIGEMLEGVPAALALGKAERLGFLSPSRDGTASSAEPAPAADAKNS